MRPLSVAAPAAATLLAAVPAALPREAVDVRFVDSSIDVATELPEKGGTVLSADFVDLDGDGRLELLTAVWSRGGNRRELRVRRFDERGVLPGRADLIVPIMEDVVAFAVADVRAEPGRELVFLTKSGAWSYSLAKEGYRGNIARLAEAELLFDVPAPRDLPRWRYVVPSNGGRDLLLLPLADSLSLWRPGPDGDGYVRAHNLIVADRVSGDASSSGVSMTGSRVRFDVSDGDDGLFLDDVRLTDTAILSSRRGYAAPALVDVDGDGALDVVRLAGTQLHLHLGGAGGPPAEATRLETVPSALQQGEPTLRLVDVDGDGALDVVTKVTKDEGGALENSQVDVHVYLQRGGRSFGEVDQLLRFEAAELRFSVADVDGDRRPDLIVRKFEVPGLLSATTGVEFKLTTLLYLGKEGEAFGKRPVMRQEQVFNENTVQGAIMHRSLTADLSDDGLCDLVSIELNGEIAVRRLQHKSSFFGGERWELEARPWKSFDARGNIGSLQVRDFNGDGLGDILSVGDRRVTVLLSQRVGGRR